MQIYKISMGNFVGYKNIFSSGDYGNMVIYEEGKHNLECKSVSR